MIASTKKIVSASKLAEYLSKRPPEYASEIEPFITRRFADGSIEVDTHHPAWQAAMAKYRSARHYSRPGRPTRLPPPNQQPPEPTFAQERRSICDRCPEKPTCYIFQGNSPCRAKNLLKRPGMVCLADPPKWLPVLPVQEDVAARKK